LLSWGFISAMPSTLFLSQTSGQQIWATNRVPLQKGACVWVAALQFLKGARDVRSPTCPSPRLKLEVSMKDLLKGRTVGERHAVANVNSSKPTKLQKWECPHSHGHATSLSGVQHSQRDSTTFHFPVWCLPIISACTGCKPLSYFTPSPFYYSCLLLGANLLNFTVRKMETEMPPGVRSALQARRKEIRKKLEWVSQAQGNSIDFCCHAFSRQHFSSTTTCLSAVAACSLLNTLVAAPFAPHP